MERVVEARIPTEHGTFNAVGFRSLIDDRQHIALVMGELGDGEGVLTRVHSECLTGDVFGSLRCDCGDQLDMALARVAAEGRGVVLYIRGHEGQGHRPPPQAGRLPPSGRGPRHRRRQREPRPPGRLPGTTEWAPRSSTTSGSARCAS